MTDQDRLREGDATKIVRFLEARYDEDEAIAQRTKAASMEWRDFTMDYELRDSYNAGTIATSLIEENREHIARWDPARVLREVQAKRRTLELHISEPGQHPGFCWYDRHEPPCPSLRHLAAVYAGHSEFDEAWAL